MATDEISEKAKRVHREAIIVDMLEVLFPPECVGYFKTALEAGVSALNYRHEPKIQRRRISNFYF